MTRRQPRHRLRRDGERLIIAGAVLVALALAAAVLVLAFTRWWPWASC